MSNLNNSPSAGPLTAAELNKIWPPRRVHADDWPDTMPSDYTPLGPRTPRRRSFSPWGAVGLLLYVASAAVVVAAGIAVAGWLA